MAFKRFFQEYTQLFAAGGAGVLHFANIYPQIWGLPQYMKTVQLQKQGWPAPLDADLKKLSHEILHSMKLDAVSEACVRFFAVYGQDMLSKGSTVTKYGAIIGIPITFTYESTDDVQQGAITLKNRPIAWDSAAGHSLKESLIFSEKAKKFAILRELMNSNSFQVHSRPLLLTGWISFAYMTGFIFSRVSNLQNKSSLSARIFIYSVFGAVGAALYYLTLDKYNWYRDKKNDKKAAKFGKEFAEGGIEYYNQLLKRNIALRALLKEDGPKNYTVYGNVAHSWRSPDVPLTIRRDNVTAILKSYDEHDETTNKDKTDSEKSSESS